MTDGPSSGPNVPDHVDEAVRSVTQLHSDHHGRTTAPQRAVNRITAFMARPFFIALVGLGVVGWIGANLIASALGLQAIDAPAFLWLQGAANLFSLFVVMLVLVAQKHEDELNAHRDTLTLELAILSEHKIAKVIQLLEELRRDSPTSRTAWIARRTKWLSPRTPDRFWRLHAQAMDREHRPRRGVEPREQMPELSRLAVPAVWCAGSRLGIFDMQIRYGFDIALELAQPATILAMMDVHSDFRHCIAEETELEVVAGDRGRSLCR